VPSSLAQKYEIMPYLGYRWGGAFKGAQYVEDGNIRAADLEIEDGGSYGLLGSIALVPGINLEILYERQSSELKLYSVTLKERVTLSDIDIDYFQVGLLYEFYQLEEQKIRPFMEITLGGTRLDPKEGIEGETRFSGGFAFGAKAFLNERFGVCVRCQGVPERTLRRTAADPLHLDARERGERYLLRRRWRLLLLPGKRLHESNRYIWWHHHCLLGGECPCGLHPNS
jgi:hypothetical protein